MCWPAFYTSAKEVILEVSIEFIICFLLIGLNIFEAVWGLSFLRFTDQFLTQASVPYYLPVEQTSTAVFSATFWVLVPNYFKSVLFVALILFLTSGIKRQSLYGFIAIALIVLTGACVIQFGYFVLAYFDFPNYWFFRSPYINSNGGYDRSFYCYVIFYSSLGYIVLGIAAIIDLGAIKQSMRLIMKNEADLGVIPIDTEIGRKLEITDYNNSYY